MKSCLGPTRKLAVIATASVFAALCGRSAAQDSVSSLGQVHEGFSLGRPKPPPSNAAPQPSSVRHGPARRRLAKALISSLELTVVNRSSHQITGMWLRREAPRANGSHLVRTDDFIYLYKGQPIHTFVLTPSMGSGRPVFQDFSIRPQCVFDLGVNLDSGTFYRSQQNLCGDPRIVVTDLEIRLPPPPMAAGVP